MQAKVWDKKAIVALINTNDAAVARAITALYQRQTATEQSGEHTNVLNGVGFNKIDAPFLTSIAKALPRYNNHMTSKQIAKARPMLRKYWRQLLEIANDNGVQVAMKAKRVVERAIEQPPASPLYGRFG